MVTSNLGSSSDPAASSVDQTSTALKWPSPGSGKCHTPTPMSPTPPLLVPWSSGFHLGHEPRKALTQVQFCIHATF